MAKANLLSSTDLNEILRSQGIVQGLDFFVLDIEEFAKKQAEEKNDERD